VVRIDIVSDVVCPWCYVGKRQLERAIEQLCREHPQMPAPEVVWHPFQLNPDMPEQGMDRQHYLERKFGNADTALIYARVKEAAAQVGLDLPLEHISRVPNTQSAHALMAACQEDSEQAMRLAEGLFQAFFVEHHDLSSPNVLRSLALGAGLTSEQIEQALSPSALTQIQERDAAVREQGITGVPFFVVNQSQAVSGAVGTASLYQLLQESLKSSGYPSKDPRTHS
jgi:predicted DsbA family dithiol-disulfide isomerase